MQMIDFLERGHSWGASQPCFVEPDGRTLDYGEVMDLTHRIANGLHAAGISRGEHVGVLSQNHLFSFVVVLGIVRSLGVWMPVNARNAMEENVNILARGDCQFLFVHSSFAEALPTLREAMPHLKGLVGIDAAIGDAVPSLEEWAARQDPTPFYDYDSHPDDVFALRGTGGTTGLPKAVMVTHRVFGAMFTNWFASMPVTDTPVHLVVAPMSHAAGVHVLAALAYGGSNIILASSDPAEIMKAIERYKVNHMYLPPTLIYKLLAHPDVEKHDYSSLKYLNYSSAPMSVEKLREALRVFGPVMVQAYGQAEAPGMCTVLTAREHLVLDHPVHQRRLASCGRPSPFVRLEIMGPDGKLLGANETGELVVRGDIVMKGYYKNPEATAKAMEGGWLHTGDVGYRDEDGYVYIVDRMKDLIISGGFNIAPGEIEQVLWSHPAVGDCAVIGVPDETWGEAVKAAVELKPGASVQPEELIAYCRERLGGMKTPKSVDIWDALPRSQIGKVLKKDVRERYWGGQGRRVS